MIPLRDENPSASRPVVNYLLLLANVLVFIYMWTLPAGGLDRFVFAHGAVPAEILGRGGGGLVAESPTLLTSMFMHGGWLHLGGNMLYLWIFGDNVEDLMGHAGYFIFYLVSGLVAVGTHILLNRGSTVPLIGASGAIAGVLGAYLVLFPRARIVSVVFFGFFLRLVAVPALFFLPVWFLLQLISGVASLGGEAQTVAFWAHVGGFVAGVVLVRLFARPRRAATWG